jgi:hypothetical protein
VTEDDPGLWPVLPSETVGNTLADPAVPAAVFSAVAALTVEIAQDPWLDESQELERGPGWREILIRGQDDVTYGIAEYYINEDAHHVILTRVVIAPDV